MRLARLMVATLLIVALLTLVFTTAFAEGKGYWRFDNPGKGHDWGQDVYENNNENNNNNRSENGYRNHLPLEQDDPETD